MKRVRANAAAVVVFKGKPRAITDGMEVDVTDDVVRDYPWLFDSGDVERATAAPCERRNVRVPKR